MRLKDIENYIEYADVTDEELSYKSIVEANRRYDELIDELVSKYKTDEEEEA
jgi:hypothetical protein